MADTRVRVPVAKRRGPRYTPVSRRQDRPNAILWLLRNHPELKDAQIMRLVGTTKPTIESIRGRTHWNANSLAPMDPVTLGLCSQIDLDFEVEKAAKSLPPQEAAPEGATLLPASETIAPREFEEIPARDAAEREAEREADAVFAKLKSMKGTDDEEEVGAAPRKIDRRETGRRRPPGFFVPPLPSRLQLELGLVLAGQPAGELDVAGEIASKIGAWLSATACMSIFG